MTAELLAFLRARLDEQEAAAAAAGGTSADWRALGTGIYCTASLDDDVPPLVTTGPEVGGSDEDAARTEHIALHDPAQVLREVEATRGLLKQYTTPETDDGLTDALNQYRAIQRMAVDMAVRHLAQAYADHPDYQPQWHP
ncbi:DUF6221 family protein [Streptomyces sp. JH34]|uniref:DUF6221 family protein n=1 Tax=Streptomyces sp. JH34 TaxID=2793633 RepID=UPI0023F69B05|nr:DUF6221 family protein [Streptomyces sp. JH34]MDF6017058.1 DUF6221 family protein [Streptomyces sp. JH34]